MSAPAPGREVGPGEMARAIADDPGPCTLATHRNPDGDAIGSLLGLARALRAQGRDVLMWHPDRPPVPEELAFLLAPGEAIVTDLPADAAARTLIVLDCASERRLADAPPATLGRRILNIDHHHDNSRFGELNLVDAAASSTAELVARVLEAAGWPIDRTVAEPLYVGLVTDTGRFMYSNTSPEAHRVAGVLLAAGVDAAAMGRTLYESVPLVRARLLGRGLAGAETLLDGRLAYLALGPEDFAAAGTDDADGLVEALRGIRGVDVAAVALCRADGATRVSLRAANPAVDVSAIAHAEHGGGHPAAAGFTTHRSQDDLRRWLAAEVGSRLDG
ncbi:MAG TPA: bifunctional oligoribonuclease/PAP phosphatase NrnA [Miltoncostaeaceae bacterium]|nr:bifunctional oligoribonuclease/PAP phosphatase NrnA [Miltoncostaeaceae bacterium]